MKKFNKGKTPLELLPPLSLEAVADILDFGKEKYGEFNFLEGDIVKNTETIGSVKRHINEYMKFKDVDDESGKKHLAHAVCQLMILLEQDILGIVNENRPQPYNKFNIRQKRDKEEITIHR